MDEALGEGPFNLLVDLGTGTGRILELFGARAARSLGFDLNHAMLAYARMKLERAGLSHAQVRHGDLYNVPLPDGAADAVVLHQVLHFLDDPAAAIAEASRLLAPGGRLLVVDFAPHELEFLREQSAHRRLGFARDQLGRVLEGAGLKLARFRELKPEPSGGKLTVSLWLGEKPAVAGKKRKTSPQGGGRRLMLASSEHKSRYSRPRRHRRVVRVLPAQDGGHGEHAVAFDPAARAASPEICLGHLWRGRLDARAHPRHRGAHAARDHAEARRASHLRRRDQGRDG